MTVFEPAAYADIESPSFSLLLCLSTCFISTISPGSASFCSSFSVSISSTGVPLYFSFPLIDSTSMVLLIHLLISSSEYPTISFLPRPYSKDGADSFVTSALVSSAFTAVAFAKDAPGNTIARAIRRLTSFLVVRFMIILLY